MSGKQKINVGKVAMCGLFVALALIFSYVESLLPLPFPVAGMKLGLANIAIIAVLYFFSGKDAFFVNLARILLMLLLLGNPQRFFFSIAGGMASLGIMVLLKKTDRFSIVAVSAAGGTIHNVVQLFVAMWVLSTPSIAYLMPIFIITGLVTGIICGIAAKLFLKHIFKMR